MNQRIKILRKEYLHLTQEDFANRINISRSNFSNLEAGRITATERVLSDIIREFNVNPEWLLDGKGEMFLEPTTSEFAEKIMGTMSGMPDECWEALETIYDYVANKK